jgi:hypothetical protein
MCCKTFFLFISYMMSLCERWSTKITKIKTKQLLLLNKQYSLKLINPLFYNEDETKYNRMCVDSKFVSRSILVRRILKTLLLACAAKKKAIGSDLLRALKKKRIYCTKFLQIKNNNKKK